VGSDEGDAVVRARSRVAVGSIASVGARVASGVGDAVDV